MNADVQFSVDGIRKAPNSTRTAHIPGHNRARVTIRGKQFVSAYSDKQNILASLPKSVFKECPFLAHPSALQILFHEYT
jgi:hypothetical protein